MRRYAEITSDILLKTLIRKQLVTQGPKLPTVQEDVEHVKTSQLSRITNTIFLLLCISTITVVNHEMRDRDSILKIRNAFDA